MRQYYAGVFGLALAMLSWSCNTKSVPLSPPSSDVFPEQPGANQVDPPRPGPLVIKITPEAPKVRVGSSLQLHADSFGYRPGDGFLWRSLNKAIARVSERGVVTGVAVGQTRITAAPKGDTAALAVVVVVVE
jgi:Bacterial Ig-like domain (group 2).